MANKIKSQHIVQSAQFHTDHQDVDVEQRDNHTPEQAETASPPQYTPAPVGGYPFAPPFMQPKCHKRMLARAKHETPPAPEAQPAKPHSANESVAIYIIVQTVNPR